MKISWLSVVWLFLVGVAAGQGAVEGETPNRLIHETSPYLRLHAYNPVDWYPWGEEAFERARQMDRPIFLSVGYSTCYWCHVMERLVFSDPAIAELMNRGFVNIKVDREERPDIDEIYMTTTQILTGRGGWPNSVFLTPDLLPFFAGTYFPPADQGGRPGFPTILGAIGREWDQSRAQIEAQAKRLSLAVEENLSPRADPAVGSLPVAAALEGVAGLKKRFDEEWGGFGAAPKFPSPGNLLLLWRQAEKGDAQALEMVLSTLASMGRGAIYDQLDGGFHRYTLDRAWRIPHFEKMLYDNALLAEILSLAAARTGDKELERLSRGTLDFMLGVMKLPNGAFKSAIDAETEGVEGAFYIWDRDSLDRVLGEESSRFLAPILGFDGPPNFEEEHYTLFLTGSLQGHANRLDMSRGELLARIEPLLVKLSRDRARRQFPLVDEKVLTDWNGMAIAALAQAGQSLSEDRYTRAASRTAEFILGLRDSAGTLQHVWNDGQAKQAAFLDDYAFLIHGLLKLYEATGDPRWRQEAEELVMEMERQLREPTGRYFTSPADDTLMVRSSSGTGGAIPAGNGVAILNLLELAQSTGRPIYLARAWSAMQSFSAELAANPMAMPTVARAVLMTESVGLMSGESDQPAAKLATLSAEDLVITALKPGAEDSNGEWRQFELFLSIRDGWHINANPASLDLLIPTRLAGDLRTVVYPLGTTFRPAFAGEELRVYDGEVSIKGEMSRRDQRVHLTYQACDDQRCLPPVTREIRPLEVPAPDN